jgi:hypothetical protein
MDLGNLKIKRKEEGYCKQAHFIIQVLWMTGDAIKHATTYRAAR